MNLRLPMGAAFLAAAFALSATSRSDAQSAPNSPTDSQEAAAVSSHARGEFDVKLTPLATDDPAEKTSHGRMTIDKTFHGDLEATSRGEMLAAGTAVPGSAGYVALELVTGRLGGRTGSFSLQHSGTMARGVPSLSVTVVPDSGTGELTGLAGSMTVRIEGGKHFYELDYTFGETP